MPEQTHSVISASFRSSFENQHVTIPSIYKLVPEWKPDLHNGYEIARDESLNPWIRRWAVNQDTARSLCAADFGRFAALLVPNYRSYKILSSVSKYFAWYFLFDDIFDCGSLKYDQLGAERYRDASLEYFRFTLLGQGSMPDLSSFDVQLQNALHSWNEIGEHIREACSLGTRELLCTEMLRYISSLTNVDSLFKDDQEVPSIKKYWERREATAGAFCVIATIPFAYGVDVDKSVYDNPVMYELWRHASSFVHISNDMFSFRKELMDDQYENLIPVLMLNYNINCNVAMQKGYDFLRSEASGLRLSSEMLPSSSENLSPAVSDAFIRGCFDTAMGLAHWSYSGARYLKGCNRNDDNTISFTIHRQRQLEETKTHYEPVQSKLPSNTGDPTVLDKIRSMAPKLQGVATL
ncbi:hypothetical protein N7539_008048 [Penicillium diatomitis]|uniref:Terpene synthase n=1 Tax=Penicillium diatomitis TaxID=2819901 RepID=A0A9W9WTT3_9EURO|nr:uncharacterized protein N7539_008048 [Penicillium diatomitis]KAJ5474982.1 hypothetical protein N7539_008048 [Penicillium diatomitis]